MGPVEARVSASVTLSWIRLVSGTTVAAGPLRGTGGRTVSGGGPAARASPKAFRIAACARSGVTAPITTIVVRSGRTTRSKYARTAAGVRDPTVAGVASRSIGSPFGKSAIRSARPAK